MLEREGFEWAGDKLFQMIPMSEREQLYDNKRVS